MVHTAVAYARQKDRLQTWACTASVGPGSTNMLTGAALATINRIPVLLLPSGTFATRVSAPVLQELELPYAADVTVNDAFRPLSRFFDRVSRPEQLPSALLGAMRVLTDPVETGRRDDLAAAGRAGRGLRLAGRALRASASGASPARCPRPSTSPMPRRSSARPQRPLVVAGGGVHYSRRRGGAAPRSARRPASPSARRRPARAPCRTATRRRWAPSARPARRPPTRSPPRPTSSSASARGGATSPPRRGRAFQDDGVRFVNVNVARFDAGKHAGPVGRRRRPRGADRPDRRPSRGMPSSRRLPVTPGRAVGRVGRARSRRPTTPPPRSPTRSPPGC